MKGFEGLLQLLFRHPVARIRNAHPYATMRRFQLMLNCEPAAVGHHLQGIGDDTVECLQQEGPITDHERESNVGVDPFNSDTCLRKSARKISDRFTKHRYHIDIFCAGIRKTRKYQQIAYPIAQSISLVDDVLHVRF